MCPSALSIAATAARVSAPVWAEKVLMLMMPMPSFTSHFTGFWTMISRVMVAVIGFSWPGRTSVSVTLVLAGPRICEIASSSEPP